MSEISTNILGSRTVRVLIIGLLCIGMAGTFAVGGAVAQENGSTTDPVDDSANFCEIAFLAPALNSLFSIFVIGGIIVGIGTWVITSFTEAIPFLPQDIKKQIKKQRNSALVSMGRIILGPAVLLAVLKASGVVIPECIEVFQFG